MKSTAFVFCSISFTLLSTIALGQNAVLPSNSQLNRTNAAPSMQGQTSAGENPVHIGPLDIGAGVYYRYISGGRIGDLSDGSVQEAGLVFNADLGESGNLFYSPHWSRYSDPQLGDRFSQEFGGNLGRNGSIHIGQWTVELSPEYSNGYQVLTETGELTQTESWGLDLIARYQINGETSVGVGTGYNSRDSERFNSSNNTNYQAFINRIFAPGINTSLIFIKGSEKTNTNFDAQYDQISASIGFQPSEKIYFSTQLGRQSRSFNVVDAPDYDSFVYSFGLNYTPIEYTRISIRAGRSVGTSLFDNQTRDNENLNIYLNQRVFGWVDLSLGIGRNSAKYLSAISANSEVRSDSYDYFDARLSAEVLKNTSISIFYRDQKNESDISQFGYRGDQHGIEVGYSF